VQHFSLYFHGYRTMIWAFAVTMAGPIESDGPISFRQGNVEPRPIMAGTGVTMNQHDGPSRTLHHKVKIRVFDLNEQRISARVTMSYTAVEIALL
jgi:hypothetical protein